MSHEWLHCPTCERVTDHEALCDICGSVMCTESAHTLTAHWVDEPGRGASDRTFCSPECRAKLEGLVRW